VQPTSVRPKPSITTTETTEPKERRKKGQRSPKQQLIPSDTLKTDIIDQIDSTKIEEEAKINLAGVLEENSPKHSPRPTEMNSFKNAILERRKSAQPDSLRKSPDRRIDVNKLPDDIFSSKAKDTKKTAERVQDTSKTRKPFKIYTETTDDEKSAHKNHDDQ
jgi:hypothetical protein